MNENDENFSPFIKLEFKTARGSSISVKEDTIKIAKTLTNEDNQYEDKSTAFKELLNAQKPINFSKPISGNLSTNIVFSDFQTGSGKRLAVSKEKLNILSETLLETEPASNDKIFSGFQTGSGKKLTVSKELVDLETQKISKLSDHSDVNKTNHNFDLALPNPPNLPNLPNPKNVLVTEKKIVHVSNSEISLSSNSNLKQSSNGLRDAKPFKRPQFVSKTNLEKPKNESPEDQSVFFPLNDLFDLPVQKPSSLSKESTTSSNSTTSSSSLQLTSTKFNNFHLFSQSLLSSNKVAYLKITNIQVEHVRTAVVDTAVSMVVRPLSDLVVVQDVELSIFFYSSTF